MEEIGGGEWYREDSGRRGGTYHVLLFVNPPLLWQPWVQRIILAREIQQQINATHLKKKAW
ncbi:hypothetical protein I7I50_09500 [Histoplasma capsulatum G186AR]|uniref:Uncharacterized protein n=1 Tax=Ajellomyces capsulatus TaxID=5037 RepID=A0A8H8CZN9_AJECA|nr:hypothetical protein I7I52_07021 [Histoplasma capsulatum]QSS74369.1 hypothetical protein I7I50_09500 [Histoplasma capsulatum G186AR]